jgi:hypothetical protein
MPLAYDWALREVTVRAYEGEVHVSETLRNGALILGVGPGDGQSLVDVDKIHRRRWRRCDRRGYPDEVRGPSRNRPFPGVRS